MIKVGGTGSTKSTGSVKKKKISKNKSSSGSSFASFLSVDDSNEEVSHVDSVSASSGVDAIIAAQNVGDATDEQSRRKLIQRGEKILDRLDLIREGLLRGTIPKDKLIELAQMIREKRENISDSRLSAILDEIELRAEVEIAKLSLK